MFLTYLPHRYGSKFCNERGIDEYHTSEITDFAVATSMLLTRKRLLADNLCQHVATPECASRAIFMKMLVKIPSVMDSNRPIPPGDLLA